jgi:hypothetical protein
MRVSASSAPEKTHEANDNFMGIAREGVKEPSSFEDTRRRGALHAKQLPGFRTEGARDRFDRRQARIPQILLEGRNVARRQPGAVPELL